MDRYIIVKQTDEGAEFRYITEAVCQKHAEKNAGRSDPYKLIKAVPVQREHELVRNLIWHQLQTRNLVSQLEDATDIECSSIMDTLEAICSGLDCAPLETDFEKLDELLGHIRGFGTIESYEDAEPLYFHGESSRTTHHKSPNVQSVPRKKED